MTSVPAALRPLGWPSLKILRLGDWLGGRDAALLADSLSRFVGQPDFDLPTLQADLARFAFLLGGDGELAFGPTDP